MGSFRCWFFFFYFSFTFLNSKTNLKFKNSIKVAQMDHYWTTVKFSSTVIIIIIDSTTNTTLSIMLVSS